MDVGATGTDPGERREGLVAVAGGGIMGFLTNHVGARLDLRYLRQASVATTFRHAGRRADRILARPRSGWPCASERLERF